MTTALRVSFCFFTDPQLRCQVSRTLLQYFQRYPLLSISTFQLQTVWRHHWSNLHYRKMPISLKRKKIFQNEKGHSSVFWKAFQISTNNFSFHRHFKVSLSKRRVMWSDLKYIWDNSNVNCGCRMKVVDHHSSLSKRSLVNYFHPR